MCIRDRILIEQRPMVQAYLLDSARDEMIAENAAIALVYSGEAPYATAVSYTHLDVYKRQPEVQISFPADPHLSDQSDLLWLQQHTDRFPLRSGL